MNIALKEASEKEYWIRLLSRTNFLDETQSASIMIDCVEVKKLLHSIVKNTKNKEKGNE